MKIDKQEQASFFNTADHQYDLSAIKHPPYHTKQEINHMLRIITKHSKGTSVIDFGAGTGRVSIPLLRQGFHVVAVDVSKDSLARLSSIAHQIGLHERLTVTSSLAKLSVDAIVGADILHHVSIADYTRMFPKHLRPHGILVFSEPNILNISWFFYLPLQALMRGIPLVKLLKAEKGILQCRHSYIRKQLQQAGFKTIIIYGHGIIPPPLCSWSRHLSSLNYFLSNLPVLKLFAYRLIIFAEK